MGIASDLRMSVLQSAIQGKLTKQLASDGDASDLLVKIKAEKEQLVKDKKIKKEKPLAPISDDEKPFDIPDNWVWSRIGELVDCSAGSTPQRGNSEYWINGTIPWLKTGELTDSYIKKCEEYITEKAFQKCSLRMNHTDDILIALYGATIGKLGIVTFDVTTNQACLGCTAFNGLYNMYLFIYFKAIKEELIGRAEGGAQPNISREKVRNTLISLPPLAEQERIVNRVNAIMKEIDELEKIENELEKIKKEFPTNMKSALLQSAMQGKLTEQLESDGDADILIEQINNIRSEGIKNKTVRNVKCESTFDVEDIYYDVPNNWRWMRFGQIVSNHDSERKPVAKDKRINKKGTYPYYGATGAIDVVDSYLFDGEYLMIGEDGGNFYTNRDNSFIARGKFWANNHVHVVKPIGMNIMYLKYFLDSCNLPALGLINGIAVPKLNQENMNSILVPIPPLSEQERIVAKLDKLLPLCNSLSES